MEWDDPADSVPGVAITLTELQASVDAIDRAIGMAELEVELPTGRTRYRTAEDMLKARAHLAGLVNAAAAQAGARTTGFFRFQFQTSRGE